MGKIKKKSKKRRKIHNGSSAGKSQNRTNLVRPSITHDRPDYNTRITYKVVPIFEPADPRASLTSREGRPGTYRITSELSIPGRNVFREIFAIGDETAGDTLLAFPVGQERVRFSTQ